MNNLKSPMQTEKSQLEGKRIMPEVMFNKAPELFDDPRVKISRSASETDILLFILPMTLKLISYHSLFILFLTFYVTKRHSPNVIRRFSSWTINDVTSEIKSSDVMFNSRVSCLSSWAR